jgi:tripartite-type tricarboxylate transporter receptor subunit TctC
LVRKIGLSGVLHVPYQDTRAIPDLAAGRNTFHIDAWSTVAPWVSARKLLVLAGCGVEHMAWGPGVPTVASVIGQEFDMSTWHAVFAPKPTSSDILDLLNQEINATMAKDSVQQAAIALGFKPYPCLSRRDVAAFVATDRSRWKRFVEVAGVERQ